MKKYLFGITAILLAISLSAYNTIKTKPSARKGFDTYYYFQVKSGEGSNAAFLNSQVTYHSAATSVPTSICEESNSKKCVVGFLSTQVNGSGPYTVKDNGGNNPQTPAAVAGMRYRSTE